MMHTIDPDAPADKPETEQMRVIHRALTREFTALPGLVERVAAGDTARARLLGAHLTLVLDMLHEHHEAEDELIWPLLHERVPMDDDLIDTMEHQHQRIAATIDAVRAILPIWSGTAAPTATDDLAARLRELEKNLAVHLDLEEEAVLPLVHQHLTVPEWRAPQKHAMAHGPRRLRDKLLAVGIVLDGASPREQAWFRAEMPPPARLLWRLTGARQYAAHRRAVAA